MGRIMINNSCQLPSIVASICDTKDNLNHAECECISSIINTAESLFIVQHHNSSVA